MGFQLYCDIPLGMHVRGAMFTRRSNCPDAVGADKANDDEQNKQGSQ